MAILTAPCMSLNASGKLANSLVFAGWKGIKYARQYVKPANPNSGLQQIQRGFVRTALLLWHDVANALNALDKDNLNRSAAYVGKAMSGFNVYTRNFILTRRAGVNPLQLYGTTEVDKHEGNTQFVVHSVTSTVNVKLKWGYSPTAMLYLVTRTEAATPGTTHTFNIATLTAEEVIFYQMYDTTTESLVNLGTGRVTILAI